MKCSKCGKPLGFNHGQYVAKYPDRHLVGHHWSHLVSAYQDPARILRDFRNPPEGNLGDIYRLDLGIAYSSREDKLRKDVVLACCGNDAVAASHRGQCAMGIDNDDSKHWVIGIRTGPDRFVILRTGQSPKNDRFKQAYDLLRPYNIRSVVVDLRPNADSARDFANAARAIGVKVLCAEYTDSILQDSFINDDTGIIKIYRTGAFDTSHRLITSNSITLPRQCASVDEFARQCCNCVKAKEMNSRGQIIYRYKKTGNGEDHFRNALNYFIFAARRIGKSAISGHPVSRPTRTNNEYVRC